MKKQIIISTLILTSGILSAQTSKGNFMLGGNIGHNFNETTNQDTSMARRRSQTANSSFAGSVSGGYFIKDNIAVGIVLGYSSNSSTFENEGITGNQPYTGKDSYHSNMISAGAFFRQYKMLGQSRFGLFYQVSGTYGVGDWNQTQKSQSGNNVVELNYSGKSSQLALNLNPGITYFVTNRIGLEATLGYIGYSSQSGNNNRSTGFQSDTKTRQLNANFSLSSLSLGVRVYLGKKKEV
ncbi:MAG: outer membrane beta-barrel protein [Bacteroidia bacterium]|nr:outer membrane beta-barrel protein [Bacteroidia bacterium]